MKTLIALIDVCTHEMLGIKMSIFVHKQPSQGRDTLLRGESPQPTSLGKFFENIKTRPIQTSRTRTFWARPRHVRLKGAPGNHGRGGGDTQEWSLGTGLTSRGELVAAAPCPHHTPPLIREGAWNLGQ